MADPAPNNVTTSRQALSNAIADVFRPYQSEIEDILARAEKIETEYRLQNGDANRFLELRRAAMEDAASRLGELLKEHPEIWHDSDRLPKNAATLTGYNKVGPIFENEQLGFFAYQFAFAPHQETPPHTHPGLCVSYAFEGSSVETTFGQDDNGVWKPVHAEPVAEGWVRQIIGPTQGSDLHVVHNPSPDSVLLLVHLYDAWDTTRIHEGVVTTQFETHKTRNGVNEVHGEIAGYYPKKKHGKSNPGEAPLARLEDFPETHGELLAAESWAAKVEAGKQAAEKYRGANI